jgi:hypothetical protein
MDDTHGVYETPPETMIDLQPANAQDQYECDLPTRPVSWGDWRVAMEPTFTFTDHNGVGQSFFDYYTVDTFDEAVIKLFDERKPDPVGYRCYAVDVTPAFEWYARWPLLRRSKRGGFVRRQARQGAAPWEFFPDNTLFEVWRRPDGPMGFAWTYMLRVGGRTQREAMENWEFWAAVFRRGRRAGLQRSALKQPCAMPG